MKIRNAILPAVATLGLAGTPSEGNTTPLPYTDFVSAQVGKIGDMNAGGSCSADIGNYYAYECYFYGLDNFRNTVKDLVLQALDASGNPVEMSFDFNDSLRIPFGGAVIMGGADGSQWWGSMDSEGSGGFSGQGNFTVTPLQNDMNNNVPEPVSGALVLGGLGAVAALRRKKEKTQK